MPEKFKIAVKFPTRDRPVKFTERMDAMLGNAADLANLIFYLTLDSDDATMTEKAMMQHLDWYREFYQVSIVTIFGISENKIHAVNRDVEKFGDWDILLLMSDDMRSVKLGWDEVIRNDMPLDTDTVLYYLDGFTPLNTMPIIGRKYYERFNYVYNPLYKSFFCDNEFHEVAEKLGKHLKPSDTVLFRHEHPANCNIAWDKLYEKNQADWKHDEDLFFSRREKGYDL